MPWILTNSEISGLLLYYNVSMIFSVIPCEVDSTDNNCEYYQTVYKCLSTEHKFVTFTIDVFSLISSTKSVFSLLQIIFILYSIYFKYSFYFQLKF